MSGGNCQPNIEHSSLFPKEDLQSTTPDPDPHHFILRSFSQQDLEVLKSRRDFVEAMTAMKTMGDAQGVFEFGTQLLDEKLKLKNVDYATVLMFAIHQLTITVVLA